MKVLELYNSWSSLTTVETLLLPLPLPLPCPPPKSLSIFPNSFHSYLIIMIRTLVLFFILFSVSAADCTDKCQPLWKAGSTREVLKAEEVKKNEEQWKKDELCLSQLTCPEARALEKSYQDSKNLYTLSLNDIPSCMQSFYNALWWKKVDCGKHDFLSIDLKTQKEAFTSGKQCFLDYAKAKCVFLKKDVSYSYLSGNYEKFVEIATQKPVEGARKSFDSIQEKKCSHLVSEFQRRNLLAYQKKYNYAKDDKELLAGVENCDKLKVCQSALPSDRYSKSNEKECNLLKVYTTDLPGCLKQIAELAPSIKSKYSCLGSHDLASTTYKDQCERLGDKKECVRSIFKDHCPQGLTDFDKNVAGLKQC